MKNLLYSITLASFFWGPLFNSFKISLSEIMFPVFFIYVLFDITKKDKFKFNVKFFVFSLLYQIAIFSSVFFNNLPLKNLYDYFSLLAIFIILIVFSSKNTLKLNFNRFFNLFIIFSNIYFFITFLNYLTYIFLKKLIINNYSILYYKLTGLVRLGIGLEDPNFLATKILILLILIFYMYDKTNKKIYVCLFYINSLYLFLTLSLSGYLAFVFLIYFLIKYKKMKITFIFIYLLIGLFIGLAYKNMLIFFLHNIFIKFGFIKAGGNYNYLKNTTFSRINQILVSIYVIFSKPFGIGHNNFEEYSKNFLHILMSPQDIHNSFFAIASEYGGIFGLYFLLFWIYFIIKSIKNKKIYVFLMFLVISIMSSTLNLKHNLEFFFPFLFYLLNEAESINVHFNKYNVHNISLPKRIVFEKNKELK